MIKTIREFTHEEFLAAKRAMSVALIIQRGFVCFFFYFKDHMGKFSKLLKIKENFSQSSTDDIFLLKSLQIWKICCTFAADLNW